MSALKVRLDRKLRIALVRSALIASGAILVAGAFAAGWVLRGEPGTDVRILELARGGGFTVLISPGKTQDRAIYQPTGEEVDFLANSDMNALDPSQRFLFTSHETGERAGVTRIDLVDHDVVVLFSGDAYTRLDGLVWTPWGTLLVAEETPEGKLFEVVNPLASPADVRVIRREAFGIRKHEGLAIDGRGFVYGGDEDEDGSLVRFVPAEPLTGRALEAGRLEVLVFSEDEDLLKERRIAARWLPHGDEIETDIEHPEDIEIVGSTLYVAVSGEDQVLSVDLRDADRPIVGVFVDDDRNAASLDSPDNLASDPSGNLYISEDVQQADVLGGSENQIWLARPSGDPLAPAANVELFATLRSIVDEPSGLLVDRAGEHLYLSILGPNNSIVRISLDAVSRN